MRKLLTLVVLSFLLSISYLQAQDSTAADDGKLTITGYLDNYYFKNLNNPLSGQNWGSSGFERIFDANEGQFQIGLIQTKFAYSNSKSDFVADLTFGPNADLGNYGNTFSLNVVPGVTSTALAIKQAYWTYKFTGAFSATAGLFGTHIGYEVIDAPVNFNYSLSNLFGNGPFYHTGLKFNLALGDRVGLMAGIVNNWDSYLDNNRYKTGIAQVFLKPAEGWNIYLNFIGGREDSPSQQITPDSIISLPINTKITNAGSKMLFDLTTGYQLGKFYIGLNYAYGFATNLSIPTVSSPDATGTLTWGGAALYSNFAFADAFALGIRAEYFDNSQGVQYLKNFNAGGAGTNVTSLTATANITLANGHFLLKPEIRTDIFREFDYSGPAAENIQQFQDSDGNWTKSSQTTIGMAAIYKF